MVKKAEIEKEALKTALKAKFVNEDGSIEEWNDMSWEEVEEKIENEFRLFKEKLSKKWRLKMKTFIKGNLRIIQNRWCPHTLALEYTISDVYERLVSEGLMNEDLRKWFGKGKTGSSGGGWDRYGSDGQKLGKCGDGKEGGAYAACLSQEKAAKLGPKGRAAFVRRKRAAQKKGGDSKKGGNRTKGKAPTNTKTGA